LHGLKLLYQSSYGVYRDIIPFLVLEAIDFVTDDDPLTTSL